MQEYQPPEIISTEAFTSRNLLLGQGDGSVGKAFVNKPEKPGSVPRIHKME